MKELTLITSAALLAVSAVADPADPQISNVRLEQDGATRRVTVQYDLDERAVVTMDVLTNGVSIGGANIQGVMGDCFKIVSAGSDHVVTWYPHHSWPDHKFGAGVVSVRMTAWALDNTPDYMAVDISETGGEGKQTYYPSADFVPGGVTNNSIYKTSTLLMRKIMAKGVTWAMGTSVEARRDTDGRENQHQVTLTNNYYIGVYEITGSQWSKITGYSLSTPKEDSGRRPADTVSYTDIRQGKGTAGAAASATGGVYPDPPYGESFLGLLRDKTKLDFDLPSEAQWEFAARAGNGEGLWGDGSAMNIDSLDKDTNLNLLGRYYKNPTSNNTINPFPQVEPSVGTTAVVGSYKPNSWGIYDMHGNVWEWCLDWKATDISTLNGAVNTTQEGTAGRITRGGGWTSGAPSCRAAKRVAVPPSTRGNNNLHDTGFRVVCTAGLQ